MKARTKTDRPGNYIFFFYEDSHRDTFRTWNEVATEGIGCSYLVGGLYNSAVGCVAVIDEMVLTGRPTIQMVKDFIQKCKDRIIPTRESKIRGILERCRNEIREYEHRCQVALDIVDIQRCSLSVADYGLYDRISEIIEEYGEDYDVDTEDITADDIIWEA